MEQSQGVITKATWSMWLCGTLLWLLMSSGVRCRHLGARVATPAVRVVQDSGGRSHWELSLPPCPEWRLDTWCSRNSHLWFPVLSSQEVWTLGVTHSSLYSAIFSPHSPPFLSIPDDDGEASRGEREGTAPSVVCLSEVLSRSRQLHAELGCGCCDLRVC